MTDESGRARDGNGSARDAGGRRTHDRPRLMRDAEEVRGVALAGSTAKLGENAFRMRLSAVEPERNVRLLKERSWLSIPIRQRPSRPHRDREGSRRERGPGARARVAA
jgi:hypothetical protein